MSAFRRGGAGKRRDQNEPAIVEALRQVGCRVWRVSGDGLPDLIAWRAGRCYALEVKTQAGARTEAQRDAPWPIVRTVDDALSAVLGK
jgi:Holliday junction resolvase